MKTNYKSALALSTLIVSCQAALSADYVAAPPLSHAVPRSVSDCRTTDRLNVPMLTWGGDFPTFFANGTNAQTQKLSIFAQTNIQANLYIQDDFKKQLSDYLTCRTPFLRGTQGQINAALDLTEGDPRTKMVAIYQISWSKGDYLVARNGIQKISDLRGRTVALQAYGPHVDFLGRLLKDAGMTLSDVHIRWTANLSGENSPLTALQTDSSVDAAFMITPDAATATANFKTGTGAESSVPNATVLIGTKTVGRVISDMYAVRADYYQQNRDQIERFVHGLMIGEEQTRGLLSNLQNGIDNHTLTGQQTAFLKSVAQNWKLNSPTDAGETYLDADTAGYRGNAQWMDDIQPRSFLHVNNEIQEILQGAGLINKTYSIQLAGWNFNSFKPGLNDTNAVQQPRFNESEVARVITKDIASGSLDSNTILPPFEIHFKPKSTTFPVDLYESDFQKVIDFAATYSGAVITIEGYSDPKNYNKAVKNGASQREIRDISQSARTLSAGRAISARDAMIAYAQTKNIPMDPSQFSIVGHGVENAKHPNPANETEWLDNMRVVFRVINVDAESAVYTPD